MHQTGFEHATFWLPNQSSNQWATVAGEWIHLKQYRIDLNAKTSCKYKSIDLYDKTIFVKKNCL